MANVKTVSAKIGSMRKPQDFVVYPKSKISPNAVHDADFPGPPETLTIQSETVFARFNVKDGVGRYANVPGGAYSHHLVFKGKDVVIPMELVKQFVEAQPQPGDTMGGGICVIG